MTTTNTRTTDRGIEFPVRGETGIIVSGAWTWSPFTGRSERVGTEDGRPSVASEHEDGTWTWRGFIYIDLESVRLSARRGGF